MQTPERVRLRAHAKLNLILKVLPPNDQGMHPIVSWMHPVSICDQVEIVRGNRGADITWDDGSRVDWDLEDDLGVRAHRALEAFVGSTLEAMIRVTKSIPSGGGLGGGSSDAACVLIGLNDAFGLGLSDEQLQTIAHPIGSDIPYFVDSDSVRAGFGPRPGVVRGVGNLIERTPRREIPISLLVLNAGCNTGAVYRAFDARAGARMDESVLIDEDAVRAAAFGDISDQVLINDLSGPAQQVEPLVGRVLGALGDAGLCGHVSGSGSTVFVLGDPEIPTSVPAKLVRTRLMGG